MNNAINEIKNTLGENNSRITEVEDRMSEVEDRRVAISFSILEKFSTMISSRIFS